jgi:hypothetical protein
VLGFGFWLARSPVVADAATAATSIRPRMPGADDQA